MEGETEADSSFWVVLKDAPKDISVRETAREEASMCWAACVGACLGRRYSMRVCVL